MFEDFSCDVDVDSTAVEEQVTSQLVVTTKTPAL